jgi:hypothetical protein
VVGYCGVDEVDEPVVPAALPIIPEADAEPEARVASPLSGSAGAQYGLPFSSYAMTYPLRQVISSNRAADGDSDFFGTGGAVGASEHAAMSSAAPATARSLFTTPSADHRPQYTNVTVNDSSRPTLHWIGRRVV